MTLNGQNVTLVEMKTDYGAHQNNLNDDRFILSSAKCRPMILGSRNTKYTRICAGVPREGRQLSNDSNCHGLRPSILKCALLMYTANMCHLATPIDPFRR